jgi:hypothetical protein
MWQREKRGEKMERALPPWPSYNTSIKKKEAACSLAPIACMFFN